MVLTTASQTSFQLCTAKISPEDKARYLEYFDKAQCKRKSNSLFHGRRNATLDDHLSSLCSIEDEERERPGKQQKVSTISSNLSSSTAPVLRQQQLLGLKKVKNEEADQQLNHAIANLIHSEGLPFLFASSHRF